MKLDILVIAAHPDDAELSCGGTIYAEKKQGKKVGILDLTQGELGTRGNQQIRKEEAAAAAAILSLDIRENLQLKDGFFMNDEMNQRKLITAIRKFQPEIILCNAPEDRHPDHGKSAQFVETAAFLSGLRKIETTLDGMNQEAWRPAYVFNYIQDRYLQPDFVIDISETFSTKMSAIKAYSSQFFNPALNEPQTYISSPAFEESIIYRAKMFGKMIGVAYAEGFISKRMVGFKGFDPFIKIKE